MEQRTLVPDAGEVVLDQLMVENNTRLVMLLRATGEGSSGQPAGFGLDSCLAPKEQLCHWGKADRSLGNRKHKLQ
jgi:hypothetical protein